MKYSISGRIEIGGGSGFGHFVAESLKLEVCDGCGLVICPDAKGLKDPKFPYSGFTKLNHDEHYCTKCLAFAKNGRDYKFRCAWCEREYEIEKLCCGAMTLEKDKK